MKDKKYAVIKRLFKQYQDNTIDQDRKQKIDNWFQQYQDEQDNDILNDADTAQRIYEELNKRIHSGMRPAPVVRLFGRSVWLAAACTIGSLLLIAVLYQNRIHQSKTTFHESFTSISTKNGEVKKVMLDDSSEIWLNAATRIRISSAFKSQPNRIVYLDEGEAYFEVKHNASRPFSVISGNIITKDIGTAFNIRAYEPQCEYKLKVVTGEVSVSKMDHAGHLQVLSPSVIGGQNLLYDQSTQKISLVKNNTEQNNKWWSTGAINLDQMTIKQIGDELSRHFNVHVTVLHPNFDHHRYSINFKGEDLDQLLQQLLLKTGLTYQLEHDSLTINPSDKRNETINRN